ncbi:Serine/threonine-protein kinase PAK 5 [Takifugu flavidus]|uniref:non-specific serine/threonine protein kinase n=1 Tax=Takifugu flavidus TaxID=433684 RepID=A0A5C6NR53_9TELE|nr:Serine/threonine-protein kinase PAK 5 [Takifugu flavidus]
MFGKKKKRLEISAPSNFEHRVHTGFDPREQKFTGLPQQWQSLLADTANRPKPMVDPSYITPIQLAPMKTSSQSTLFRAAEGFVMAGGQMEQKIDTGVARRTEGLPGIRGQVLELKLYPPEVKGDWVTLVSGSVGAKSVAINTHRLV